MDFSEIIPPKNLDVRHIPLIILVDTSDAMRENAAIDEVNEGLCLLHDEIMSEELLSLGVEICVITFNSSVNIVHPFSPISEFNAPTLSACGCASMNEAILRGLDEIQARRRVYMLQGISYYRPNLILITRGQATDQELEDKAKRTLYEFTDARKISFYVFGTRDADEKLINNFERSNCMIKCSTEEKTLLDLLNEYIHALIEAECGAHPASGSW